MMGPGMGGGHVQQGQGPARPQVRSDDAARQTLAKSRDLLPLLKEKERIKSMIMSPEVSNVVGGGHEGGRCCSPQLQQ